MLRRCVRRACVAAGAGNDNVVDTPTAEIVTTPHTEALSKICSDMNEQCLRLTLAEGWDARITDMFADIWVPKQLAPRVSEMTEIHIRANYSKFQKLWYMRSDLLPEDQTMSLLWMIHLAIPLRKGWQCGGAGFAFEKELWRPFPDMLYRCAELVGKNHKECERHKKNWRKAVGLFVGNLIDVYSNSPNNDLAMLQVFHLYWPLPTKYDSMPVTALWNMIAYIKVHLKLLEGMPDEQFWQGAWEWMPPDDPLFTMEGLEDPTIEPPEGEPKVEDLFTPGTKEPT